MADGGQGRAAIEGAVAGHYGDRGLFDRIVDALRAAGIDPQSPGADDLAPVEEFHIGGREATRRAVERMGLVPGQQVLDVGCGVGGAARFMAASAGCTVTGVDLTPEYIEVARSLSRCTGLEQVTRFDVGSALEMPYGEEAFDAAITLHVAMNIEDRAGLYAEIARVLKPATAFYIFDVMRKAEAPLQFPVPWSDSESTSHLTTPGEMHELLAEAGFEVLDEVDRTEFALEFFRQNLEAARNGPAPLGVHVVMGPGASEKLGNVMRNIERGCIAPVEMLARKAGG